MIRPTAPVAPTIAIVPNTVLVPRLHIQNGGSPASNQQAAEVLIRIVDDTRLVYAAAIIRKRSSKSIGRNNPSGGHLLGMIATIATVLRKPSCVLRTRSLFTQ